MRTRYSQVFNWNEFKEWSLDSVHQKTKTIFRGHSNNTQRLSTTFHRKDRRDLFRYSMEDVPRLARYVSSTIGKTFDLNSSDDYGGLLNLVQHHGFPTPLLDWTESPFVAAYFAFNRLAKSNTLDGNIRIFAFNREAWNIRYKPVSTIGDPRPSFSVLDLSFRDNQRAVPQQSVQTFSNVYDIETLIESRQKKDKIEYLTKIDINASERDSVMAELSLMNITASNLFPGLDGTCQTLREKYF